MGSPLPKFWQRIFFHVDMDAFFPAVEVLENPALEGLPVIVGGVDSNRGVVSSANYPARVFGVHSAMPVAQARRLCPHGVFLNGRSQLYGKYSRRIMDCCAEFSPIIEQISVDEAFLDMTGTEGLMGQPKQVGQRLKDRIKDAVGLTASVGIAPGRFLAKLASDHEKPNGLTVIEPGQERAFIFPLSVNRLPGIGKKTAPLFHQAGLHTIEQVMKVGVLGLIPILGERMAIDIHRFAKGEDDRSIGDGEADEKSISHECTFENDIPAGDELFACLLDLADRVARRARRDGWVGRTVHLIFRDPDFSRHSRSKTVIPTSDSRVIYRVARELFQELLPNTAKGKTRFFRLLGIRISNLSRFEEQTDLFGPKERSKLDKAMDAVRDRFGEKAIGRARLVEGDADE